MGRTIADIKKVITDAILADATFQALGFDPAQTWDAQVSKTNIFNLLAYIAAVSIWSLESLFNLHQKEVDNKLKEQKAHKPNWYRNKALDFQFGRDLVTGQDYYDNTALTDEQVETEKIVTNCAVTENNTGKLTMKLAREVNGVLAPLSESDPDQFTPFKQYFNDPQQGVKDAGVKINFVNNNPDYLKLIIDVFYDGLVLDAEGKRLDGTSNSPVKDAINSYLKNLPFNGEFSNMALIDSLQQVEGVIIPELKNSQAKFGVNDWQIIDAKYIPDAGYLRIYEESDLVINYRANV